MARPAEQLRTLRVRAAVSDTMLWAAFRSYTMTFLVLEGWAVVPQQDFDESEIRAAERRLETALEAIDRTAWVFDYTSDAVFDGGGDHAVVGRDALLAMAASMRPLAEVSIRPLRTEGWNGLATVWFEGSWISGSAESDPTHVEVRGMILWRREADGVWRVAMEHLS